jgi:hypothetical protein
MVVREEGCRWLCTPAWEAVGGYIRYIMVVREKSCIRVCTAGCEEVSGS